MGKPALFLSLLAAAFAVSSSASADRRVRLMSETTSYTDVADAFDQDDPFDLNVRVGYQWSRISSDIQREFRQTDPSLSGLGLGHEDVGRFEHTQHILNLGVDIGLFHDFAAMLRVPVILSDSRSLSSAGDLGSAAAPPWGDSFDSPNRSGIGEIQFGLAWAPLNQNRTPEVPTWVIMVQVGMPVGAVMQACERDSVEPCAPGISRGTTSLRVDTRLSRRFRHVETYGGIAGHIEWATRSEQLFMPGNNLPGYQHTRPPILGEFTTGMAIVPWENRATFQRAIIDLRLEAAYVSQGREFTALYDALGANRMGDLGQAFCPDGSIGGCSQPTTFNGLTDIGAHGVIGGRFAFEIQAARYVHFGLGTRVAYRTTHLLTDTDPCNASHNDIEGAADMMCGDNGDPNPHFRASINDPGSRFRMNGALRLDVFANLTAQF